MGALLAPISAMAQTQQQILNSIASNLPTSNANEISALALRNTLNYMTSAIFSGGSTGGVTITGTPLVGYVPVASSSTAAAWQSIGVPPTATTLAASLCSGGVGDAAAINTLLSANTALGFPASITCSLSAPLSLSGTGDNLDWLLGSGLSTQLQPSASIAALIDIAPTANAYVNIEGFYLSQVSTDATSAVHYHPASGNNYSKLHDLYIVGAFTNGILIDATAPGGDSSTIYNNFFLNQSGYAINYANFGINGSAYSNYILGSSGINLGLTGNQPEGIRFFNNTTLASVSGASAVNISAGLELSFFFNILDQNYAHGVIVNAATHAVSAVKFVGDWIGASGSVAATQDGFHLTGTPEYLPLIANTVVGWSNYGFNSGTGGAQHITLVANKFYNNTTGDAYFNDVAGVALFGNTFASSSGSWTEVSLPTGLTAVGNRCTTAATGITTADVILGDGSCGANQIPGPLTLNGNLNLTGNIVAPAAGATYIGDANGTLAVFYKAGNQFTPTADSASTLGSATLGWLNVYSHGYYANGSKGVTCTGAITVISSITITDGIITAASGTGGTCS